MLALMLCIIIAINFMTFYYIQAPGMHIIYNKYNKWFKYSHGTLW